MKLLRFAFYSSALLLIHSAQAAAQDTTSFSGSLGAGAVMIPQYEGSEDFSFLPYASIKLQKGDRYISAEGTALKINVLEGSRLVAGPMVNYRFGRDDDIDNARVARMAPIDAAVELGGFVAYDINQPLGAVGVIQLSLEGLVDVSGQHGGWLVNPAISYLQPITERLFVSVKASTTVVSDDYATTNFGVSSNDAAASGLDRFDAKGGFKDVAVTVSASYAITEAMSLETFATYSQLIGDAADSPITARSGQVMTGLGLRYNF